MSTHEPVFTDLMIDCETLSLAPRPYILSIAVGAFNALDLSGCRFWSTSLVGPQPGADIDADTVRWWLEQDRATLIEALGGPAQKIPGLSTDREGKEITLREFLVEAITSIATINPERIWVRGIDHFWLENHFKALGLKAPWKYNQVVDLRSVETAAKLAGYPGYNEPEGASGPRHSALADVVYQINATRSVMQWLKTK